MERDLAPPRVVTVRLGSSWRWVGLAFAGN